MIPGSCFINHGRGWSCTNMATFVSVKKHPKIDGKPDFSRLIASEEVRVQSAFHYDDSPYKEGDTVHIAFKFDDDKTPSIALYGEVYSIQKQNTFIKIIGRIADYSEIIRNITLKIKGNGR